MRAFYAMKITTFFQLFLLCLALNSTACRSAGPGNAPASVEEAEKQLAKKRKKEVKAAEKEMKRAKKEHWKRQSKATRKSVKRNERRQKKLARQRRG